jgi:hypothetical protein
LLLLVAHGAGGSGLEKVIAKRRRNAGERLQGAWQS